MKGQQAIGTLVIFIALVITAALATFVILSATNQAGSKASAVSGQTIEGLTTGFQAVDVKALSKNDGEANVFAITVKLAAGSPTIDLKDATIEYSAASNTVYETKDFNSTQITWSYLPKETNTSQFWQISDRSNDDGDNFLESGESITLGFVVGTPLKEGEDWTIVVSTPYTTPLEVSGVAPDVIQSSAVIDLH